MLFDFEDVHTAGVGVVERVRESVGKGKPPGRGMKNISLYQLQSLLVHDIVIFWYDSHLGNNRLKTLKTQITLVEIDGKASYSNINTKNCRFSMGRKMKEL